MLETLSRETCLFVQSANPGDVTTFYFRTETTHITPIIGCLRATKHTTWRASQTVAELNW